MDATIENGYLQLIRPIERSLHLRCRQNLERHIFIRLTRTAMGDVRAGATQHADFSVHPDREFMADYLCLPVQTIYRSWG